MTVKEEDDIEVKVEVMETHIGHEAEVGRLSLKKSERATIAEKLFQEIPNRRIFEDIGKTFNADDRFNYTTNRDIHNIKNWDGAESKTRPSNLPDINLNQSELTRDTYLVRVNPHKSSSNSRK
jgi:hypothetical protein